SALPSNNVEHLNGPAESLWQEIAQRLGLDRAVDCRTHFAVNQNFVGLCPLAEAGSEIHDRSYRGVVKAAFKADPPERRVAIGDSNTEAEATAKLMPSDKFVGT